jgi:hypothetical protein
MKAAAPQANPPSTEGPARYPELSGCGAGEGADAAEATLTSAANAVTVITALAYTNEVLEAISKSVKLLLRNSRTL